jgi:hypothetical protein
VKSAAEEIVEHRDQVAEGLRKIYAKSHFVATDEKTPLDSLLADEESPKCPHCKEAIEAPAALEQWAIRNETIRVLYQFFAQDGPELQNVLRNVFAVGAYFRLEPWVNLTVRDRGIILDESHGTQHHTMRKNCVNLVRRKGGKSFKAPGEKSLESHGTYSMAQQGNENRKRKPRSRHKRLRKLKKAA